MLSTISDRITTIEQIVQRTSNHHTNVTSPSVPLTPSLPVAPSSSLVSALSATPSGSAHSLKPSVLTQLQTMTTALHAIISSDPSISAYLCATPDIRVQLLANPNCSAGGTVGGIAPPVTPPGASDSLSASLLASSPNPTPNPSHAAFVREESIVVSAAEMFTRTSVMMAQMQTMQGVIEKPWPIEDLPSLDARLQVLSARLPGQALAAAQQQVAFDHFLANYASMIELSNQQLVRWSEAIRAEEDAVDKAIAEKKKRGGK